LSRKKSLGTSFLKDGCNAGDGQKDKQGEMKVNSSKMIHSRDVMGIILDD
jgi:hypothetical protein